MYMASFYPNLLIWWYLCNAHSTWDMTTPALSGVCISKESMSPTPKLVSVHFEVFGRVQGVFFRKYTQQQALKLGVRGWCMNTSSGTVKGVLEGAQLAVNDMKKWLQSTGSPQSSIQKAVFTEEKEIPASTMTGFKIVG